MIIRSATATDLHAILQLFEETVRAINMRDYTPEQIDAWASAKNEDAWSKKLMQQFFFVAESSNGLLGFSSIDRSGYLDFLYVHKDHQGVGIATALLKAIEDQASQLNLSRIWASVSTTAQPFFIKKGYQPFEEEHKQLLGVTFINALMEKQL